MLGFGKYNPFPLTFGGGESTLEVEHLAMLDELAPGWDVSEGTAVWNEAYAHAGVLSLIWSCNERLKNQALPLRMLENLTVWEEATGLRPTLADLDGERRRRVAAKLRGLAGNRLADISDTCSAIFGDNFSQVTRVDPANGITYWPGGPALPSGQGMSAPGPPGFEWSTNRVVLLVVVTTDGLSSALFQDKRSALYDALDTLIPAWMTITIGVGSSFIVNVGIVGQTYI